VRGAAGIAAGIGLVGAVFVPMARVVVGDPGRDSGVFLYAAWRILGGAVPYRDVWDHKMPGIFFIDALGLILGRGSDVGVLALEFAALSAACVFGFLAIRRAFGTAAACLGSFLWIASLPLVLEGGNLPEEFALPLQFLALLLFVRSMGRGVSRLESVVLGLSAGAAFALRQNLIGIWIAIVLCRALTAWRTRNAAALARDLVGQFAGFMSVQVVWVVYLQSNNALGAFWQAAFGYSIGYSDTSWSNRLDELGSDLMLLCTTGLAVFAVLGWFEAVRRVRRSASVGPAQPTHLLVIIGLPIELVLGTISGRLLPHHALACLPILAFAAACLVPTLASAFSGVRTRRLRVAAWALSCGLVVLVLRGASLGEMGWLSSTGGNATAEVLSAQLDAEVPANRSILVWGAEARINFLTRRAAPTRFVYQYPLFAGWYRTPAIVSEFFADLENNRPPIILDTSHVQPEVMPLDAARRSAWLALDAWGPQPLPPQFEAGLKWLNCEYTPTDTLPNGWKVYRLRSQASTCGEATANAAHVDST